MRQPLIALSVMIGVVLLRAGFVYLQGPARPPAAKLEAPTSEMPDEFMSPHLRILMFYSAEESPRLGQPSTVCYGVTNAVSVKLDPPLAEIKPSISHCVEVTVNRPQVLTLTATGKEGEQAVAAFRLGSTGQRPAFTLLQLSTFTPRRGDPVTLCYGTYAAERVSLLPGGPPLKPGKRQCIEWHPDAAHYRLVAESQSGRDEVPLPLKFVE
jgi:hypothetical protein